MITDKRIITTGEQAIGLSPQEVVVNATIQARLLMDIVNQTKCFQLIAGKKYLQVEAWETIGAFNTVHAATEYISPIMREGVVVGYDAKVNLVNKDGLIVGSAVMPCYFTENACKGKEGDGKDKAAKSAAQTFATSKAYRMNYSYIAILAGYEPCPAEEMTGTEEPEPKGEFYCQEHKTFWFKRGKMKVYGHPIEGSDRWCSMPKPQEPVKVSPPEKDQSEPSQSETKTEVKVLSKLKRDPTTIKTINDLIKFCWDDFGIQPKQVAKELGVSGPSEITETMEQCYLKIAAVYSPVS